MGNDKQEQRNQRLTLPGKGKGKSNASDFPQFVFVDTYLNDKDKQWLSDNRDVADEYVLSLFAELEDGNKLSVSFDQKSSRFLATFSDNCDGSPNRYKILTARGSTPVAALFSLAYKHRHKSADGLWGNGGAVSEFD